LKIMGLTVVKSHPARRISRLSVAEEDIVIPTALVKFRTLPSGQSSGYFRLAKSGY
jgi:hypothetical protein